MQWGLVFPLHPCWPLLRVSPGGNTGCQSQAKINLNNLSYMKSVVTINKRRRHWSKDSFIQKASKLVTIEHDNTLFLWLQIHPSEKAKFEERSIFRNKTEFAQSLCVCVGRHKHWAKRKLTSFNGKNFRVFETQNTFGSLSGPSPIIAQLWLVFFRLWSMILMLLKVLVLLMMLMLFRLAYLKMMIKSKITLVRIHLMGFMALLIGMIDMTNASFLSIIISRQYCEESKNKSCQGWPIVRDRLKQFINCHQHENFVLWNVLPSMKKKNKTRKQTNATNVTLHLNRQEFWRHIWKLTLETNLTNAINVNIHLFMWVI